MTDEQRDTLIAWLTRQIEAASIDYDDCIKRGLSHSAERLWGAMGRAARGQAAAGRGAAILLNNPTESLYNQWVCWRAGEDTSSVPWPGGGSR
jgi:hypothetical protein